MSNFDLENKVVVVTGGAMGIGKAISRRMAREQARLVLADVNEEAGAETIAELERLSPEAGHFFVKTDVSSKESVGQMMASAWKRWGGVDILVNNAGINTPRLLVDPEGKEEIEEGQFDRIVGVNLKGVFLCAQAFAKRLIAESRPGVIVNMASESGLEGSHGQSVYAATKAGVYSFTRSWAKELGPHGIRVVGLAPGILEPTPIRSPEYERGLAYTRGIAVEQLRAGYEKKAIPLRRVGRLDEVAEAVCFLASDSASYITGTVLNFSGGKSRA